MILINVKRIFMWRCHLWWSMVFSCAETTLPVNDPHLGISPPAQTVKKHHNSWWLISDKLSKNPNFFLKVLWLIDKIEQYIFHRLLIMRMHLLYFFVSFCMRQYDPNLECPLYGNSEHLISRKWHQKQTQLCL